MPEEVMILKDKIRSKENEINAITRELKDTDSDYPGYGRLWDSRIAKKEELAELQKTDTY